MNREIRPLTGIRGIAACWVVACHWAGSELTGLGQDIALHGYAAVDLFMILSGFVLAINQQRWSGLGAFVWQRFSRLYPLYALTTFVSLMEIRAFYQGPFQPGGPAILSNFLMTTTNLWNVDAINGPSWSISIEFTLNLFFPLFVLLCLRSSQRWSIVVAGICAVALVSVSILDHRLNGGVAGGLGTLDNRLLYLRCGPEFALGMLCWRLCNEAPWSALFGRAGVLCPLLIAMMAMTPFKALDLPFVAASCALVIGLSVERSRVAAIFGTPVLHWLGTISFSLYLWHAPFLALRPVLAGALGIADPTLTLMAANTLNLCLVLAASTLSYHWFEVPVRRWLRTLGH